jgi:Flp pilus assembly protein TadG
MEFAFIVPMLLALIFGVIELGRAMYIRASLQSAVEEGSRCLALKLCDTSNVKAYAASHAVGIPISENAFTADPAAACGAQVTASYVFHSVVPLVPLNATLQAKSCRPAQS